MQVLQFKYFYNSFQLFVLPIHFTAAWMEIEKEMNDNLVEQLWSRWATSPGTAFGLGPPRGIRVITVIY